MLFRSKAAVVAAPPAKLAPEKAAAKPEPKPEAKAEKKAKMPSKGHLLPGFLRKKKDGEG